MNVGVIGAGPDGLHARAAARALRSRASRWWRSADPAGTPVAEELGIATVHADALELIADPAVDAVVVASPAATHEPYVLACIEAGKPVLCEKPLATSAAAALRIVEAERRRAPPGHGRLHAPLRPGLRRPQGPPGRG